MIDNAVLDGIAHHASGTLLKPGSNVQFARFLHLFDGYQQVFDLHFGNIPAAVRGEYVKLEITQHPLLMFRRPVHVAGDPFARHGLERIKGLSTPLFLSAFFRRINAF